MDLDRFCDDKLPYTGCGADADDLTRRERR